MSVSFSGRAAINPLSPEALGICGRCGFQYNLRDLRYQKQWAGPRLITLRLRVCNRCYDVPNEQERTIRIPPDPVSVADPRPEDFILSEYSELLITKYIGWDYMFGQNVSSMSAALDQKMFLHMDAAFSDTSDATSTLQHDHVMSSAFSDTSDVTSTLQQDHVMSSAFSDTSDVTSTLQHDHVMSSAFSDTSDVTSTLQRDQHIDAAFSDTSDVTAVLEQTVPASLAFLQSAVSAASQTTYNFTSQNFGTADATREIVVSVMWYTSAGADTLNSASIGGVSATIHVQNQDFLGGSSYVGSAIISASVPTGTSGTISVTFSAGCLGAAIGAYRVINLTSTTPHDTDTDDADVINMTLNIPDNGVLVASAMFGIGVVTTSGMTEDFDAGLGGFVQYVGGSATGLSMETGRALSFDGATGEAAGVAASWG